MKNISSTTYIFVVDIMRLIRAIVPEKRDALVKYY